MKRKWLPWFRFYVNTIDDLEISKLSDGLFRIWVGMMCLTSEHGGTLPAADVIAFRLRRSEKNINEALKKLTEVGLLEGTDTGGTRPHNWDSAQFKSDNSTERAHASRERRRNVATNAACNVAATFTATAPEREGDTDAERDAESDSEGERERARPADEGVRTAWPNNFKLSQTHISYAAKKHISPIDTESIFGKFRNHCQSHGKEYANWDAAFFYWLDQEVERFRKNTIDRNKIDDRL